MTDRVYLLDGSNLAFRAFFGVPGLTNSRGEPTNALFGFVNMLLKLIREREPTHMAVVFDPKGGSFRNRIYPDYKGHRPDMPVDLRSQFPLFEPLCEVLGLTYLNVPDYEADDVMGTLASRFGDDADVWLVTGDKDLQQLVTKRVRVFDPKKGEEIGEKQVEERFGCPPAGVPEVLGLMGDSSDNIPGVPKVGLKKARMLIEAYGTIEGVYEHIDEVRGPALQRNLTENRDQALLSRQLATIEREVPVEATLADLAMEFPPREQGPLKELFERFGFQKLLPSVGARLEGLSRDGYRLVLDREALDAMVRELSGAELIAFDTETTGLLPMEADLVGISLCADDHRAYYVPIRHFYLGCPEQLPLDEVIAAVKPLLEDPERPLVAQNAKYDVIVLRRVGISPRGLVGDTMVADYLIQPARRTHKLDDLALTHLQHPMIPFKEVVADPKKETFASVPLEKARDYAAEDAHVTYLLHRKLSPRLDRLGLSDLYRDVEVPLVGVLADMEEWGVAVDVERLEAMGAQVGAAIEGSVQRIHELAGREFNINSPKQLAHILFEEMGLPVIRKTKSGPSTDARVLSTLAARSDSALPGEVLDYRERTKLKSTYLDVLPRLVNPHTGRIHTSYNQTVAATGRLSSSDPNLQNIPVRTEEGRRIRTAFVAPPGRVLLSLDYSQIELRVLAHLAGEGGFARAFAEGADVHRRTAAEVFEVMEPLVVPEQRRIAKAVNFGIVYGQTAYGLSESLGISRAEANRIIERYNARYPELARFREGVLAEARETGSVTTILGRHRPITDLQASNRNVRMAAERAAINTPVQGSAADIIKVAMVRLRRRLAEDFPGQMMIMQVHDELVFEVDEDRAEALQAMVVEQMETAVRIDVPLRVDVGQGLTWADAH